MLWKDVLYPILDRLSIARQPRSSGFHRFRHLAGSFVNALAGNLKFAWRFLDHSNINTTKDIYTHISEESERVATLALERAIHGNLFSIPRTRTAADQISRKERYDGPIRDCNEKGRFGV